MYHEPNIDFLKPIAGKDVLYFYDFWIKEVGARNTVLLSIICAASAETTYCDYTNLDLSKKLFVSKGCLAFWLKDLIEKKLLFRYVYSGIGKGYLLYRHLVPYLHVDRYEKEMVGNLDTPLHEKNDIHQKKPTA